MKGIVSTACVLLSVAALANTADVKPSAAQIMQRVVANLPADQLHVSGELVVVRKWKGVVLSKLGFRLDAKWGAKPANARYTIEDAFGRTLESLAITYDDAIRLSYSSGSPLVTKPIAGLSKPIQDTNLSWMDLTLAFLWWPESVVVGDDSIRTIDCYIVDVIAPDSTGKAPAVVSEKGAPETPPYARVRLWISKKGFWLVQAEGYDTGGNRLRRLRANGFKKIDDQWMIKELEVWSSQGVHQTKLRIAEVTLDEL